MTNETADISLQESCRDAVRHLSVEVYLLTAKANRLEQENAKLQEYITKLEQANIVLDSDNTDLLNDMKDMQFFIAENAKLRELAAGIGYLLFAIDADYCVACPRDDINHPCPVYTVGGGECLYKTDLRELGVEVGL